MSERHCYFKVDKDGKVIHGHGDTDKNDDVVSFNSSASMVIFINKIYPLFCVKISFLKKKHHVMIKFLFGGILLQCLM